MWPSDDAERSLAAVEGAEPVPTRMSLILRDSVYYSVGDILVKATSLITVPIFTRIFDPKDYGVLSYVMAVQGLVIILLTLGLDNAFARFFFDTADCERRKRLTSTVLISLVVISALICVPAVWYSEELTTLLLNSPENRVLVAFAFAGIPFTLVNSICAQALRNEFRPKLFLVQSIATTILAVTFSLIAVLVLDMGIEGVFGGMLVGAALMTPVRLWSIAHLVGITFSVRTLRLLLQFGIPLVIAGLAYWILTLSDRIMIGRLGSVEQVGLYSIAMMLCSILFIVLSGFGQSFSPHVFKVRMESPAMVPTLLGRVFVYLTAGFGVLSVALTSFAPEILSVLVAESFEAARYAVGPLALGVFAYSTTQVTAAGISIMKKTRYIALISWGAAAVNITLNVMLIPWYGMVGAAIGSMFSFVLLSVGYLVISQRLYPVAYEKRKSITAIVLTFVFTAGAYAMPEFAFLVGVLLKGLYVCCFGAALYLSGVIEREELRKLLGMFPGGRKWSLAVVWKRSVR